jgi:hypothetical protein
MGAYSFLDRSDHDIKDANARWAAYLELVRRTGEIQHLRGLDGATERDEDRTWSLELSDEEAWGDPDADPAPAGQPSVGVVHDEIRALPEESPTRSAATSEGLGADSSPPKSRDRRPIFYGIGGACLGLAVYFLGAQPHARFYEKPPLESRVNSPLGQSGSNEARAPEKAAVGGFAAMPPIAKPPTKSRRLATTPVAVSRAPPLRHPHKIRVRPPVRQRCSDCRAAADDAPHKPLPPIWPDGKTLDLPPPP